MPTVTKTTSYLPAQELLAKYPGRWANLSASLAACYVRTGLPVPLSLLPSNETIGYIETKNTPAGEEG